VLDCNTSPWEAKAGRLQVQGYPGILSKFQANLSYGARPRCKKKKGFLPFITVNTIDTIAVFYEFKIISLELPEMKFAASFKVRIYSCSWCMCLVTSPHAVPVSVDICSVPET
jgi:hypothetical protein